MIFETRIPSVLIGLLSIILVGLLGAVSSSLQSGVASPELYFLNVGQGDSELIILPGGQKILIDGGPDGKRLLENLAVLLPPQDRYIDVLMMTHPQLDHFVGFIDVLRNYSVGVFVGSARKGEIGAYAQLHSEIEKHAVPYIQLLEGDAIRIGKTNIHILSPSVSMVMSGELNDTAVVALLESPEIRALYTGDIGANIEESLARKYDIHIDVLKIGHHGSRFSTRASFLQATTPRVAIIEVGKNTYGHPTLQTLNRLTAAGVQVFRTDKQGIIKILSSGGELIVSGNGTTTAAVLPTKAD